MEEEHIQILAENIRRIIPFGRFAHRRKEKKTICRRKTHYDYVEWTDLA